MHELATCDPMWVTHAASYGPRLPPKLSLDGESATLVKNGRIYANLLSWIWPFSVTVLFHNTRCVQKVPVICDYENSVLNKSAYVPFKSSIRYRLFYITLLILFDRNYHQSLHFKTYVSLAANDLNFRTIRLRLG